MPYLHTNFVWEGEEAGYWCRRIHIRQLVILFVQKLARGFQDALKFFYDFQYEQKSMGFWTTVLAVLVM